MIIVAAIDNNGLVIWLGDMIKSLLFGFILYVDGLMKLVCFILIIRLFGQFHADSSWEWLISEWNIILELHMGEGFAVWDIANSRHIMRVAAIDTKGLSHWRLDMITPSSIFVIKTLLVKEKFAIILIILDQVVWALHDWPIFKTLAKVELEDFLLRLDLETCCSNGEPANKSSGFELL